MFAGVLWGLPSCRWQMISLISQGICMDILLYLYIYTHRSVVIFINIVYHIGISIHIPHIPMVSNGLPMFVPSFAGFASFAYARCGIEAVRRKVHSIHVGSVHGFWRCDSYGDLRGNFNGISWWFHWDLMGIPCMDQKKNKKKKKTLKNAPPESDLL